MKNVTSRGVSTAVIVAVAVVIIIAVGVYFVISGGPGGGPSGGGQEPATLTQLFQIPTSTRTGAQMEAG